MNLGLIGSGCKIKIFRNAVSKNYQVKIHKKYIRKGLSAKATDRTRQCGQDTQEADKKKLCR